MDPFSVEMANLPSSTTEDQLHQLCITFGNISSIRLDFNCKKGRTRKAIIQFIEKMSAEECIANLNGFEYFNEFLYVTRYDSSTDMIPRKNYTGAGYGQSVWNSDSFDKDEQILENNDGDDVIDDDEMS